MGKGRKREAEEAEAGGGRGGHRIRTRKSVSKQSQVVKKAHCSAEDAVWPLPPMPGTVQPPVTLAPGNLTPSSASLRGEQELPASYMTRTTFLVCSEMSVSV